MTARFALIGASGRVAKLMIAASADTSYDWAKVPQQFRRGNMAPTSKIIRWDGLSETSEPLMDWMHRFGQLDALVVLAGVTPATSEDMSLNVSIAKAYLRAAAECNIPRVILASSSAVYGVGGGSAFAETDSRAPVSEYGRSKCEMEDYANTQSNQSLEVCCIRIGNIAGADALLLNAQKASQSNPLKIDRFSNGRGPQRSYMSPKHLADVLMQLATTGKSLPSVLNVAGISPIYMEDLATATKVPWVYRTATPGAHSQIVLDTSLLSKFVDLPPRSGDVNAIAQGWLRIC